MKTMIEGYTSFPGEHCGSVAMRGLLNHYCGLELPEPAVFGLGSGASCAYLSGGGLDPSAMVAGRTSHMEQDLATNLQLDYREQPEEDDEEAWRIVREEVLAGRPTMLTGDILYLDYREYKVHFPAHRFVLLGFDDEIEKAYIADRIRPEPELCSYGALKTSRNPPEGMSTHNLWGRFHDTAIGRELVEAARIAIAKCASGMLAEAEATGVLASRLSEGKASPIKATIGIAAIRAFANDVQGWQTRDDAQNLAGFNASCIEKFGNGGGNFRRLYAGFLGWAAELDPSLVPAKAPGLCVEAADGWTGISNALFAASKDPSDPEPWKNASLGAARLVDIEERLFGMLAEAAG